MPTLVGGLQLPHLDVPQPPPIPATAELDAHASNGMMHRNIAVCRGVDEGDVEEVLPKLEGGADPEVALVEGDEASNVLNPIGIKVLELHTVMVEQPAEEPCAGVVNPRSWKATNETT